MIDHEQVLRRHRKSIPDEYFTEFSALDLLARQRRGQPISDYTDEFISTPSQKAKEALISTPTSSSTSSDSRITSSQIV
ncbi:unnamed protein product [Caenorhabditis nigoni]